MSQSKLLERLKALRLKVDVAQQVSEYNGYVRGCAVVSIRPKWWLHKLLSMLAATKSATYVGFVQDLLNIDIVQVAWAKVIGRALSTEEDESTALCIGAIHAWPIFGVPPPALIADDREFTLLIYNSVSKRPHPHAVTLDFVVNRLLPERYRQNFVNKLGLTEETIKLLGWTAQAGTAVVGSGDYNYIVRVTISGEVFRSLNTRPAPGKKEKEAEVKFQVVAGVATTALLNSEDYSHYYGKTDYTDCLRATMVCIFCQIVEDDVVDQAEFLRVYATVPSILTGATKNSTERMAKHFSNLGANLHLTAPTCKAAAREAWKAWDYLQAFLAYPGVAKGVQETMYLYSMKHSNMWFRILGTRMNGYGFTALNAIMVAFSTFPTAPWSMFFSRASFGADEYSIDSLEIRAPWSKYTKLVKMARQKGYIPKDTEDPTSDDGWGTLILTIYSEMVPKENEFPELLIQGSKFIEDYARYLEDPLIMYTGVEGMSSFYPDLAYFAVSLIKKWIPGSQLTGYQGAPQMRCKQPILMDATMDSYGDYLAATGVGERTADITIGRKLIEIFTSGEGALTKEEQARVTQNLAMEDFDSWLTTLNLVPKEVPATSGTSSE